jgi:hypothetical protein
LSKSCAGAATSGPSRYGGVMTSLGTSTIGAPPLTAWTICVDETEPMSIDPALSCRAQHADEPMTISSTCTLFAV